MNRAPWIGQGALWLLYKVCHAQEQGCVSIPLATKMQKRTTANEQDIKTFNIIVGLMVESWGLGEWS